MIKFLIDQVGDNFDWLEKNRYVLVCMEATITHFTYISFFRNFGAPVLWLAIRLNLPDIANAIIQKMGRDRAVSSLDEPALDGTTTRMEYTIKCIR